MSQGSKLGLEEKGERLSRELLHLKNICQSPTNTYGDLVKALSLRGHTLVTLFFCFPFVLPVPLPGVSQVIGPIIGLAGFYMLMNWPPRVPRRWAVKPISGETLAKIFGAGEKIIGWSEKFIKPRLLFLSRNLWIQRLTGACIIISAGLLSLPYPPGTNAPPAVAILLLSVGTLERDGVLLLAGYVAVVLNIVLFAFITVAGVEGMRSVWHYLFA